jgi:hypothetical protein
MQEGGVVQRHLIHASSKLPEIETHFVTVDFKSVEPIFCILLVGTVTAIVLLILEVILHKVSEMKLGPKGRKYREED